MTEFNHTADLRSLIAAVANSSIVVAAEPPARDFADWCGRQNADLDMVILDWLRSQAPHRLTH